MSGADEANLGKRPIHVGKKTNCLYTTNPLTGKTVWIIDQSTGKPMTARPFFVDQATGYYFVADPESGSCSWIIDPVTGEPMVHTPMQQDGEPAAPEAAEAPAVPKTQPAAAVADAVTVPAEQPVVTAPEAVAAPAEQPAVAAPEAVAVPAEQPAVAVPEAVAVPAEQPIVAAPEAVAVPAEQPAAPEAVAVPAEQPPIAAPEAVAAPAEQPVAAAAAITLPEVVVDQAQPTPPAEAPDAAATQQVTDLQAALQQAPTQPADNQPAAGATQTAEAAPSETMSDPEQIIAAVAETDFLSTAPSTIQIPGNAATSGLAITSLVLGVLAVATSFFPIVNNVSFFIGIIGFIFAIAGIVATRQGKKRGRGLAISGLILGIAAVVIVLLTQSFFITVLNDATNRMTHGATPVSTSESSTESQSASSAVTGGMSIGQSASFDNGITVSVDRVQPGIEKANGATVTEVVVTYWNTGSSNASFNAFDWRAQDSNGVIRDISFYANSSNDLSSGSLAPGGTVTGSIYFDGSITKVYYYTNGLIQTDSEVYWNVG